MVATTAKKSIDFPERLQKNLAPIRLGISIVMRKPIDSRRRASLLLGLGLCAATVAEIRPTLAFSEVGRRTRSVPRVVRQPAQRLSLVSERSHPWWPGRKVESLSASREASSLSTSSKSGSTYERVPSTMPKAIARFFLGKDRGPIIVVAILAYITEWRLTLGALNLHDVLACASMVVLWMFQEHVVHGKLLHSSFDWIGKEIHQDHHEKPYHHISIDPAPLMIGWLVVAHLLLRCALPLPIALSATLGYAASGLVYEWAHYIVHTKVKPPSAFWKRVRDNHIRHHLVDERYWLSFTLPAVDDLFGTNPSLSEVRREAQSKDKSVESTPKELRVASP